MDPARLMKSSFAPVGGNAPNDDVALLGSSEQPLAIGAHRQGIELVAMRVDAMLYFKLEVALANSCLSEGERRTQRDEKNADRDAGGDGRGAASDVEENAEVANQSHSGTSITHACQAKIR